MRDLKDRCLHSITDEKERWRYGKDRLMANEEWRENFLHVEVIHGNPFYSGDIPYLYTLVAHNSELNGNGGPKPILFRNVLDA